jgi:hypothetical protein
MRFHTIWTILLFSLLSMPTKLADGLGLRDTPLWKDEVWLFDFSFKPSNRYAPEFGSSALATAFGEC